MEASRNKTLSNITGLLNFGAIRASSEDESKLKSLSWSVYVILGSANILFHGIGGVLLILTYKRKKTPQHLLLINLSATELLRNITRVAICTIFIVDGGDFQSLPSFSIWAVYITTITYLYFAAMFLITVDRLVATVLSIQHMIVCTDDRIKWTIGAVWGFVLLVSFSIFGYYHSVYGVFWLYVDGIYETLVFLVPTLLTVSYMVFAVICYLVMFTRYIRSKRLSTSSHLSSLQLFRRSKFYVSVLLITSFMFLMVIPYGILASRGNLSVEVRLVLNILNILSDTTDFVIYVMIYEPVYGMLKHCIGSTLSAFRMQEEQSSSKNLLRLNSNFVLSHSN